MKRKVKKIISIVIGSIITTISLVISALFLGNLERSTNAIQSLKNTLELLNFFWGVKGLIIVSLFVLILVYVILKERRGSRI